jgi:hypothetical protein
MEDAMQYVELKLFFLNINLTAIGLFPSNSTSFALGVIL